MDLPELLSPERIRCSCDIQSKKRALQTLAEMLSLSLQPPTPADEEADTPAEQNGSISSLASKILKPRTKDGEEGDKSSLTEMGILDAFISRERLGNTSLDYGFALPHSRIGIIDKPIAALITLDEGIDFNAADNQNVDLILGLLVPEECNDEHLKILAKLAKRFSDADFREQIRAHDKPSGLYDYFVSLKPL